MGVLHEGEQVRDFAVTRSEGSRWEYRQIWQRKNLLLVALAPDADAAAREYAERICAPREELDSLDTACIVTTEAVPGVVPPAVLIADRWGEIRRATYAANVAGLPEPAQLIDELRGIEHECPECQGEAL